MSRNALLIGMVCAGTLAAADSQVTFHKDVLPILQKNCQTCHRPGEVAPMSFLTYKDVRPWAKAMKAAVALRKMPPWFADPQFGHLSVSSIDDTSEPRLIVLVMKIVF